MAPVKLVTVNVVPERARRMIGTIVEDVKDQYEIVHVANVDRIDGVKETVEREQPDILFSASCWTPEQAKEIVGIAKEVKPDLKTLSIPHGLVVENPQAVIDYVKDHLASLLSSD